MPHIPKQRLTHELRSFNCKRIPRDMRQSLQDPGICVLSIDPARPKFGGGKTTYFRGFGLNIRAKESKFEGVNGVFWPNLTPNHLCWFCFRSYLRTKALALLLLFTFGSAFGSAFVRKCEQKQSTLILILLTISCWFCFRSSWRTKALHSYYYLLLALFSFVSANKSNPL